MIIERITNNFDELSPAQKKAVHYIKDNINNIAFLPAKEIANQSESSEPTLHRLAKALGYEKYADMAMSMQEFKRFFRFLCGTIDISESFSQAGCFPRKRYR